MFSNCSFASVDADIPCQEEPKFVVFHTKILAIFSLFCFNCKGQGPRVTTKKNGTMVTVAQQCRNCGPNSCVEVLAFSVCNISCRNVVLGFAILMAGASVDKVLLVLKHLGITLYSAPTYFVHQTKFIFPAILSHLEQYRASLVNMLKQQNDTIWSGDSMGNCKIWTIHNVLL